jgi:hypothetical protein
MNIKSILLIVVGIVLIYIIFHYIFSDVNTLSNVSSATVLQKIDANTLAQGSVSASSNFTYSIWMYINDWNYKYGETKIVYGRMGQASDSANTSLTAISAAQPCPAVVLGAIENNLSILLAVYPGSDVASEDSAMHTCEVSNIPIQKWVNLLISVYGRTLDVYLDGKLVKTCVLPGIAKINQDSNVFVTPAGGFAGWTGKFQYFPNSTDPQEAWNIYQAGYGSSWLSGLFGNYEVKVTFSNNGTESSSFTI